MRSVAYYGMDAFSGMMGMLMNLIMMVMMIKIFMELIPKLLQGLTSSI